MTLLAIGNHLCKALAAERDGNADNARYHARQIAQLALAYVERDDR
jgi:HEPN domain-containing protein